MTTDKPYSDIGARLRMIRLAYGRCRANAFAESFGWKYASYSAWETGYRRISLDAAIAIRDRFGPTLDFIYLGRSDTIPPAMIDALRNAAHNDASG